MKAWALHASFSLAKIVKYFAARTIFLPLYLHNAYRRGLAELTGAPECYLLTVMNNNYVASAIWIPIQKDPI